MRFQRNETSVSSEEKHSCSGIFVVGVVAEFAQFHSGREKIGLRQGIGGIVLYQSPVGAQPDDSVAVFKNAVNHVVDQTVFLADMFRLDVLA